MKPTIDATAWFAAVTLFAVGDVVTTAYGLHLTGVVEAHPVSSIVLGLSGVGGMLIAKAAVLTVAYALSRYVDPTLRAYVPASLAWFGGLIVTTNLFVIAAALS